MEATIVAGDYAPFSDPKAFTPTVKTLKKWEQEYRQAENR